MYKYYTNGNMLSLVIAKYYDCEYVDFYVYNINIKTGEEITNKEILEIKQKSENQFSKELSEILKTLIVSPEKITDLEAKKFVEEQYNKTIDLDNCSVDLPMYLNEKNNLCTIAKIYPIAGAEFINSIINIDEKTEIDREAEFLIENNNDETDYSDGDNMYNELTSDLGQNEMFGLINIKKNTDETYTLYGGIYEKIDSFSANLSNKGYKKVVASGDTKYIDYYGNETTIKEVYNGSFPGEDNELSAKIYANSTWLLKFEFLNAKCILIEETNLAT